MSRADLAALMAASRTARDRAMVERVRWNRSRGRGESGSLPPGPPRGWRLAPRFQRPRPAPSPSAALKGRSLLADVLRSAGAGAVVRISRSRRRSAGDLRARRKRRRIVRHRAGRMPFASGGVIASPVTFPLHGGARHVGLARRGCRPEAVLPSSRGADGTAARAPGRAPRPMFANSDGGPRSRIAPEGQDGFAAPGRQNPPHPVTLPPWERRRWFAFPSPAPLLEWRAMQARVSSGLPRLELSCRSRRFPRA